MSASTPIPLSPEFVKEWNKATTELKPYRYLKVCIENEVLKIVNQGAGSYATSKDFESMAALATFDPCYFLFRSGAGAKAWALITYVPDTTKVAQKMLYASTKPSFITKLGANFITQEFQVNSRSELNHSTLFGSRSPIDARSEAEKLKTKVQIDEETERQERLALMQNATSKAAAGGGIGGYHQVKIPIGESVHNELPKFKDGTINFMRFIIDKKGSVIDLDHSASILPSELPSNLHISEPRFYLYSHQRSSGERFSIFIYACPDASHPSTRMVYSTSKPTVAQDLIQLGIQVVKRLEVRGGDDVTEDKIEEELGTSTAAQSYSYSSGASSYGSSPKPLYSQSGLRSTGARTQLVGSSEGRSYGYGGSSPKSKPLGVALPSMKEATKYGKPSSVAAPHPVYSLMAGAKAPPATKKKVVMPPPGAW
eukprot:TRINITY_DN5567_c0_g1_i1.p1 TRINITY_DN5567_c0_g1~~TRINITY_DN5567_c0_g1_i1.p1  ORF type:complete len:426 (+),score=74.47 TRINITY_DN5567_c0_g1_i1:384-1661(+)